MKIHTILREYKYTLDNADITMLNNELKDILSFDDCEEFLELFNKHLKYMDCTRTVDNGLRIIQTINENYKWELARCVYLANWIKENNVTVYNKCIEAIIDCHEKNIKFEEVTPPIIYDKAKFKKSSTRKSKNREGDLFPKETKKDKISKAEAKLKAKLLGANLGFGSFKFKKD